MLVKNVSTQIISDTLDLDLEHFDGGVAIWGALPAVFDTTNEDFDRGVHVHARYSTSPKKIIDKTYQFVHAQYQKQIFTITEEAAVAFTMSSIFDIQIIDKLCESCGADLLDMNVNAVVPQHEHTCAQCGVVNVTEAKCVINPLVKVKKWLGDLHVQRDSIQPERSIVLSKEKYPGGFQIWGSNPSIVWTANRLEESAIHVHAFDESGKRVVDNTYSYVEVDGNVLDIEMIRLLQIQNVLEHLDGKIQSVYCPHCDAVQFDRELAAVMPSTERVCQTCSQQFVTDLVVSNPAVDILNKLQQPAVTKIHKAGAIIMDKSGRMLAVHKKGKPANELIVPGGKLEAGENDLDSLKRELAEELNVKVISHQLFGEFEAEAIYEPVTLVMRAYIVEIEGEPQAANEIDALVWLDHDYAKSGYVFASILGKSILPRIFSSSTSNDYA